MRPARIGVAFEVIEPEVVLELTVLLLHESATARERHKVDEGRRPGKTSLIVLLCY